MAPQAGSSPLSDGPEGSGLVATKAGAGGDQPDRLGDLRVVVAMRFAQHHIVRVVIGHDVADAVDGIGQPALADDKGLAVGQLLLEEARGGDR
jgi:hypothetical protein